MQISQKWRNLIFLYIVGPALGVWPMWRLRQSPASVKLAGGNR